MVAGGLSTVSAQGRRQARQATALTGTYQLNAKLSDNVSNVADHATRSLTGRDRTRLRNAILRRLEAPESLAIDRRGRAVSMASSTAERVTFEVDDRVHTEQLQNGRSIRTSTRLAGNRLEVTTEGDRSVDYQVSFEPINGGRGLRVTRRVSHEDLQQTVVAQSIYDRVATDARLDIAVNRDRNRAFGTDGSQRAFGSTADVGVTEGTELMATLDADLNTKQARAEDPFSLTVRSPAQFEGARIEGRILGVDRAGKVAGRADMAFDFDRIRLRNGRTSDFSGNLESVRTTKGETLRVENGSAQDDTSQTGRTATRTGIGAGIGAIIGAITGGGKGAAIGAAVGAGAGAGSVFIQGRDDLELLSGSEFSIRATAP
jgi:hypothetical protein